MKTHRVFIYGSLLPGQCNHDVVAPYIRDCEEGEVSGRLIDCGAYPQRYWPDYFARRTNR